MTGSTSTSRSKRSTRLGRGLHHRVPAHGVADTDNPAQVEPVDEGGEICAEDAPVVRPRLSAASVAPLVESYRAVAGPEGCRNGVPATRVEAGRVRHDDRLAAGFAPLEPDDIDVTQLGTVLARCVQNRFP